MGHSEHHAPHEPATAHGNEHDQGWRGMVRYLSHARSLWRSEVNEAVVQRLDVRPGERVVDIGAGVGAGTVVAAGRGAHVLAVEPTPYMRRTLGLRRLAQAGRGRIEIVDGAAEATGVASSSVDAAWAVNSMHHWTTPEVAYGELARILRPGGRVLLVDEDFDDPSHPDHEAFAERHSGDHHHFHMVDPADVARGLRQAGLDVDSAGKDQIAGSPAFIIAATKPDAEPAD